MSSYTQNGLKWWCQHLVQVDERYRLRSDNSILRGDTPVSFEFNFNSSLITNVRNTQLSDNESERERIFRQIPESYPISNSLPRQKNHINSGKRQPLNIDPLPRPAQSKQLPQLSANLQQQLTFAALRRTLQYRARYTLCQLPTNLQQQIQYLKQQSNDVHKFKLSILIKFYNNKFYLKLDRLFL